MKRRTISTVAGAALAGATLYGLRRQLVRQALSLGPVRNGVKVRRGLRIPMPDGVHLAADHYRPSKAGAHPTVLIRTPYGRGGLLGAVTVWQAQRIAERGYHVVVQDVRGRFDSEGTFTPFIHEAADGRATIDWITRQPWCNGAVGMWGQSYGSFAQWAAAQSNPPALKALVPAMSRSDFSPSDKDGLELDTFLRWTVMVEAIDAERLSLLARLRLLRAANSRTRMAKANDSLPVIEADRAIIGREVAFFRILSGSAEAVGDLWRQADHSPAAANCSAHVHLIGGWYDLFIRGMLRDYAMRLAAGHRPYLTVGPWTHFDGEARLAALRLGLDWFDAHLKGRPDQLRDKPVRVYLMGADRWLNLDEWPPPADLTTLYLQAEGKLEAGLPPEASPPDHYRYDPANPTPNVGGALITTEAGPKDNRALEARADVLTFTTAPLDEDVDVIGTPSLTLYLQSSREHTAFFGRLCDVHPDGRSINVCDALRQVGPGQAERLLDGTLQLAFSLSPTAQRFAKGHRVRLQVSSGAHPRFLRAYGTGEPRATATRLVPADQTIYHDRERPSALVLPTAAVEKVA